MLLVPVLSGLLPPRFGPDALNTLGSTTHRPRSYKRGTEKNSTLPEMKEMKGWVHSLPKPPPEESQRHSSVDLRPFLAPPLPDPPDSSSFLQQKATTTLNPPNPPVPPDPPPDLRFSSHHRGSQPSQLLLTKSALNNDVARFDLVCVVAMGLVPGLSNSKKAVYPFPTSSSSHPFSVLQVCFSSPPVSFSYIGMFPIKMVYVLVLKSYCILSLVLVEWLYLGESSDVTILPRPESVTKLPPTYLTLPHNEDLTFLPQLEDVDSLPQFEDVTKFPCFEVVFSDLAIVEAKAWNEAQPPTPAPSPVIRIPSSRQSMSPSSISVFVDVLWQASTFQDSNLTIIHQDSSTIRYDSSALMVMALALKAAFYAAFSLELPDICISSDSLTLVSLLTSNEETNELKSLLHDILLVASFSFIHFVYIKRTANLLADALAYSTLFVVLSTPP